MIGAIDVVAVRNVFARGFHAWNAFNRCYE
jgi:hypothetical protein